MISGRGGGVKGVIYVRFIQNSVLFNYGGGLGGAAVVINPAPS